MTKSMIVRKRLYKVIMLIMSVFFIVLAMSLLPDIARPYTKERNITDGYALGGKTVLPDATVRKLFGASESVKIKEIMK